MKGKLAALIEEASAHADALINMSLAVGGKCIKKEVLEESDQILEKLDQLYNLINELD